MPLEMQRRLMPGPAGSGAESESLDRFSDEKTQKARPRSRPRPLWLNSLQILSGRFAGLTVHHDLERDTLAFSELTQAGAFNGADMDEHILAAAFGLDE